MSSAASNEASSEADRPYNNVTAETPSTSETKLPSYKQLLVFMMTTAVVWLANPILSLVDTSVVSMTSSAKSAIVQIAALGPATILYDSELYTTYFLAITTTNQKHPCWVRKNGKSCESKLPSEWDCRCYLGCL